MKDEGVLFEGLRLGSTQAFEELLREDDAAVRRLARLYVPEEQVAALVRQAWAVALPGLDMFTWHTTLRAWLTGILVTYGRAASPAGALVPVRAAPLPSTGALVAAGPGPASGGPDGAPGAPPATSLPWASLGWSGLWSDDGWTVLERALAGRPLDEREVLWLLDVEGWPWREVLDTLGLTEEQGADLRDRGRRALAEVVEAHVGHAHDGGDDGDHGDDADRLAGVATLLHALRPVAPSPVADPALVRTFTAWRRQRGVRAWRRWWWELDRARTRVRPVARGPGAAQPSSSVPTVSPNSSPVGTKPSRR